MFSRESSQIFTTFDRSNAAGVQDSEQIMNVTLNSEIGKVRKKFDEIKEASEEDESIEINMSDKGR